MSVVSNTPVFSYGGADAVFDKCINRGDNPMNDENLLIEVYRNGTSMEIFSEYLDTKLDFIKKSMEHSIPTWHLKSLTSGIRERVNHFLSLEKRDSLYESIPERLIEKYKLTRHNVKYINSIMTRYNIPRYLEYYRYAIKFCKERCRPGVDYFVDKYVPIPTKWLRTVFSDYQIMISVFPEMDSDSRSQKFYKIFNMYNNTDSVQVLIRCLTESGFSDFLNSKGSLISSPYNRMNPERVLLMLYSYYFGHFDIDVICDTMHISDAALERYIYLSTVVDIKDIRFPKNISSVGLDRFLILLYLSKVQPKGWRSDIFELYTNLTLFDVDLRSFINNRKLTSLRIAEDTGVHTPRHVDALRMRALACLELYPEFDKPIHIYIEKLKEARSIYRGRYEAFIEDKRQDRVTRLLSICESLVNGCSTIDDYGISIENFKSRLYYNDIHKIRPELYSTVIAILSQNDPESDVSQELNGNKKASYFVVILKKLKELIKYLEEHDWTISATEYYLMGHRVELSEYLKFTQYIPLSEPEYRRFVRFIKEMEKKWEGRFHIPTLYASQYVIAGKEVTREDKETVIKFMNQHKLPYLQIIYNELIRCWIKEGSLNKFAMEEKR